METTTRLQGKRPYRKRLIVALVVVLSVAMAGVLFRLGTRINLNPWRTVGMAMDSLDGVPVYYNGGVGHVEGRNTVDGYNLGLRYQCVEFVKRYYFEVYHHRMPDAYGHAKDFFEAGLKDGEMNTQRGLRQFSNPSASCPQKGDLLVFRPTWLNSYGHVAIVTGIQPNGKLEMIQQNPGPFGDAREVLPLEQGNGKWKAGESSLLGWLRMP